MTKRRACAPLEIILGGPAIIIFKCRVSLILIDENIRTRIIILNIISRGGGGGKETK